MSPSLFRTMIRFTTARSIWKIVFATTALLEIQYIILLMRKDDDGDNESEPDKYCQSTLVDYKDDILSIRYSFLDRTWESTLILSQVVFVWVGPIFCLLCLVEALVRAVEGRKAALDNRALDDLEEALLRAAQQSSVRLSMFFVGAVADQNHNKKVTKKVSRVLRSWVPAIATIAFWLFVLPTDVADFHHHCGSESLHDSAAITKWINRMSLSLLDLVSAFHGLVESFFWTKILPYKIHKEPRRLIQRLQGILRWIRFARFAAPLFRMGLKLQDQMRAVWKARRQSRKSDMEKQRRIDRPSLILSDIQRLLQLAKLQTTLARVPTFKQSSMKLNKISSSVIETVNKKRAFGKKISEQLAKIQKDYLKFGANDSFAGTSDLYDRIAKMSEDIMISIYSEKGSYSHRYLKSMRALLSSRRYLISPRTMFSLAWRVTVTNCLLLEIARLCASWHLSKTFSISLSQIVIRLDCKAPVQTKRHLAFITDQINKFRRHMLNLFPLFGQPQVGIAVCIPSGSQALLIRHFGRMLEIFVDAVVFIDIFIWFFTGDIDIDTHTIIPKHFFTRCIIPGTLVQVLDHPTLPDLLPGLFKSAIAASRKIGYSRCIRWLLALAPALKLLLLDPMTSFFFKHIEEDEGLMHIAESVGMMSPERKRGSLYGSSGSLGSVRGSGRRHYFWKQSSEAFNTSQVGLAYDTSPISSRYDLQSMISTEGFSTEGVETPLHPPFAGMQMQNPLQDSSLEKRKSVNFGLSLSSNELQA